MCALLIQVLEHDWLARSYDFRGEPWSQFGRRLDVTLPRPIDQVRESDHARFRIVQAYVYEVCMRLLSRRRKDAHDLVAEQVYHFLEIELGSQRLLDFVDDRQLAVALLLGLEKPCIGNPNPHIRRECLQQ